MIPFRHYLNVQDMALKGAVIVLMFATLASVTAGIFWRSVLDSTLPWTDELARFCLVWLAFLGSPVVLRQNGHIALDILADTLNPGPARVLRLTIALLVAVTTGLMCWAGAKLAWNARFQVSSTLPISLMVTYLAIPIGSFAMSLVALEQVLKGLFGHQDAPMLEKSTTVEDL